MQGKFLPDNLVDWLVALSILMTAVATAAGGTWKFLMHGRDARDKEMQQRLRDLAQFEHNTSGELRLLTTITTEMQRDRESMQREFGRMQEKVESQGAHIQRIGEQEAAHYGELMGSMKGIQGQLDMLISLYRSNQSGG